MSEEIEVVDLDQCPVKPALRVGGTIAFVLTLFPLSVAACCLPLIIAGFAATAAFIFKYRVTLELKFGMKVAILACLYGFGASTILYDFLWLGFDYRIGFETYVEGLMKFADSVPEAQREEYLEGIEQVKAETFSGGVVVKQVMGIFVASGIGGAIGGALATAIFKKGPKAQ